MQFIKKIKNYFKDFLTKKSYARRQDESTYILRRLISEGYDKAIWTLHENHPEYDICDLLDGKIFELSELVSDLKYNAPIFETSHVQCICRLVCYSSTKPDLKYITVDWKGESEEGRVVDKKDKKERSKDFYRLYDTYKKKYEKLENDKYLTGADSDPDIGLYTFNVVLDETHYYNQALKMKISNEILNIILDTADEYNINVTDAKLNGNKYLTYVEYPLSIYDYSKSDLMDITWSLEERRNELTEVMHELDDLTEWLKRTQNEINNLLINYEINNLKPKEQEEVTEIQTPQKVQNKPQTEQLNKDLEQAVEENKPNIVNPDTNKIKDFQDLKTKFDEQPIESPPQTTEEEETDNIIY